MTGVFSAKTVASSVKSFLASSVESSNSFHLMVILCFMGFSQGSVLVWLSGNKKGETEQQHGDPQRNFSGDAVNQCEDEGNDDE